MFMKKYLFIILTSCFFVCYTQAQEITFTETEHDFGLIDELEGDVYYDFQFTNTGTEPLVIRQVITGCGCTSAKWSIAPNLNTQSLANPCILKNFLSCAIS